MKAPLLAVDMYIQPPVCEKSRPLLLGTGVLSKPGFEPKVNVPPVTAAWAWPTQAQEKANTNNIRIRRSAKDR